MASSNEKKRIVVVGAGAFGLSTALYLQTHHKDTTSVLLLDSQPFPSIDSASGSDTSRAIRLDYGDPFYAGLAEETIHAWNTNEVFKGHYKACGRVAGAAPAGKGFLDGCRRVVKGAGVEVEEFGGEGEAKVKALKKRFPLLGDEEKLKGWDFYFNPNAGWANPREAVIVAMKKYLSIGGQFIGDAKKGYVVENIVHTQGSSRPYIVGVTTADGAVHRADQVIYTVGAFSTFNDKLIPGLGTQIHPTGFALAHWKLSDKEIEEWKDHPVVDIYHHGYFFPPDPATGLMKLGLGITGFTHDPEDEQPRAAAGVARKNSDLVGGPDQGRIPKIAEDGVRYVLSRWAPSLANKPFFDMKVCWDAMCPDGGWLIDHHPEIAGLGIATGGSGHGFKFLPIIGRYIWEVLGESEKLEARQGYPVSSPERLKLMKEKWRWGREKNMNVTDRRTVLQGRPVLDVKQSLKQGRSQGLSSKL